MLLNRGVSFYLFLLICGIIVIVNTLKSKKEKINAEDEIKTH